MARHGPPSPDAESYDVRSFDGYHARLWDDGTEQVLVPKLNPGGIVDSPFTRKLRDRTVAAARADREAREAATTRTSSLTRAHREGAAAHRRGAPITACPYIAPIGFRRRLYKFTRESAWLRGWGGVA